MEVCGTKAEMRRVAGILRGGGASLGLVPTMGALHPGHLALVAAAARDCGGVVASLFVNPTQFGPSEDLARYPRTPDRDLAMFRDAGVSAVFMPSPDEMYAPGAETAVEPGRLGRMLMGRLRPGHFRGVATVVTKLLNIVQPDAAFFGEKDFQQLAVIRAVVRDLDMPVRIVGVPTVREPDGLAMSSRNVRLASEARTAAPVLARALAAGAEALGGGATAHGAEARVRAVLRAEPLAEVRAVDLRDAETLAPIKGRPLRPVVILLAVRIGDVTLIDQRVVPAQKGTS